MNTLFTGQHNSSRGSVLMIVVGSMVVFVMMAALVIDLGVVYYRQERLKSGIRAAALAAAAELFKHSSEEYELTEEEINAVVTVATVFADQNGFALAAEEVAVVDPQVTIAVTRNFNYNFARILNFENVNVTDQITAGFDEKGYPFLTE